MYNPDRKRPLDRREFLGRVSGGTIAAGVGATLLHQATAGSAEAKLERRNEQPGMTYAPFGKTNLNVSRLSFGCIQLQDDRLPALEMAIERGVNTVHIADSYTRGQAIKSLGKFLAKPGNRDKVWIMVKGVHGQGLPENIDDHLKALNTDHIDAICSPIFEPEVIRKSERDRERFEALKKAGKVRFLNLTTHRSVPESIQAGIEAGWFSSILSVIDLSNVEKFQPIVQRARKENIGTMAMKTVRNAKSDTPDNVAKAMFAAGMATILKSLNTREDVEKWFDAVTKAPQAAAAAIPSDCRLAATSGMCTLCGLCEGCPNGVAIQDIVRDYTYYFEQQGLRDIAVERYGELHMRETAISCRDCGRCEKVCPMNVPARRLIREAHERLGTIA